MNINDLTINEFVFKLSITTACSNRCKHCYMYDENTFNDEKTNMLSLKQINQILDDIEQFEKKYNVNIHDFAIYGGDPLLRKDWYEILSEIRKRKKNVAVLGNPETLTEKNLQLLSDLNIEVFQMSLDGLENTHDYYRSKGSFKRTIEKIELLDAYGIVPSINFTLFPNNAKDFIPLVNFLAKNTKVKLFCFDIGCYVGNAKERKNVFSKEEIKNILSDYIELKENLIKQGYQISLKEICNFLVLTRYERKELYPPMSTYTPVIFGNRNGWRLPSVLSDGTVLVDRRIPSLKIGKMPEQTLEEIFLQNDVMKKFRRSKNYKKCGSCNFYSICRGNLAYVNSVSNDPFDNNPLCFVNHITQDKFDSVQIKDPPMDTNLKEEMDFVLSMYRFKFLFVNALEQRDFQLLYMELYNSLITQKTFLKAPYQYIKDKKYHLDEEYLSWLIAFFSGVLKFDLKKGYIIEDYIADQIKIHEVENSFIF